MKLILIHGEDNNRSYERLQKYISSAKEKSMLIKRHSKSTKGVIEMIRENDMFSKSKLIISDDISKIQKNEIDWINKNYEDYEAIVVIYHTDILPAGKVKLFKKIERNEEYKVKKLLWSFLESFYPGNAKNILILLHEVLKTEPVELIFSLLAKTMRDLYWLKVEPSGINYPSWRTSKLKNQASKFKLDGLIEIIQSLAEIDMSVKTSRKSLTDLLDLLVVTKLKSTE